MPSKPPPVPPTSPEGIVNLVTDPIRWKILECLRTPKTAKQIGLECDLTVMNAQYHVERLCEAGVVERFPLPEYANRVCYSRRTLDAKVSIRERGIDAKATVY